jgi:DNA-directed RNA polymerase subunit RPC12/RpoP
MTDRSDTLRCARCGATFPLTADHTELVRRDFVETPRPSRVEQLCADCWRVYVEEFLGRDFDALSASYRE